MIERIVLQIARARHPLLRHIFGMPQELLARDVEAERAELDRLESRFFGQGGVTGTCASPLTRACRMSLASAVGKRTLQCRWRRWARVAANALGVAPLIVCLWLASRGSRKGPACPAFCFLPSRRYADEARRILGPDTEVSAERRPLLSARVLRFLFRAALAEPRILLAPELLTNALRWLSYYERAVVAHRPAVVGNFAEGVSSMPLATAFLRELGIRSVNLQHGERLANRQVAFMLFDECHFWSAKYAQIYLDSKSVAERFWLVGSGLHKRLAANRGRWPSRPRRLVVIHHRIPDMPRSYSDGVLRLVRSLDSDWQIAVRPHPQDDWLWKEFTGLLSAARPDLVVQVEPADTVPLFEALSRARIVVGATSTALIEAWIGGAKVVLVPGIAKKESVLLPFGGSPNVLWLDESVSEDGLSHFVRSDRVDDGSETSRVDQVSLVSADQPVEWRGQACSE